MQTSATITGFWSVTRAGMWITGDFSGVRAV